MTTPKYYVHMRKDCANFMVEFVNPSTGRKTCRSTGTPDKRQAYVNAKQIVESAYEQTRQLEFEHRQSSTADAINDFIADLRKRNAKSLAYKTYRNVLLKVFEPGDISSFDTAKVFERLEHLCNSVAPKTANDYRARVRTFGKYLAKRGFTPTNVFADVGITKTRESDLVHPRGTLTTTELDRLLDTVATQPKRGAMTGTERRLLYIVATSTGLRLNEIRELRQADIKDDVLMVRAATTKAGRSARQPIGPRLREALDAMPRGEFVVNVPKHYQAAKILRMDLAAAGIPYLETTGARRDFHSLRSYFITNLLNNQVPIHVVQRLARHSSPVLTLAAYAKTVATDQDVATVTAAGL